MPGEDGLECAASSTPASTNWSRRALSLARPVCEAMAARCSAVKHAHGAPSTSLMTASRNASSDQRTGGGKNLHRPSGDHDVFALHRPATRVEVVVDALQVDESATGIGFERHKDVHVEGGDGLEIKRRTHRAADGVAFNDAIGLHLVDRGDDFFDVHVQNVSRGQRFIQFIKQLEQLLAEQLMGFAQAAALVER